jgi:hypothetical protein
MLEIVGYVSSLFIGLSLGLIGGGGSILTVPVLVYLLGVEPVTATSYSLFIVGTTSLIGAIPKYRNGLIQLKTAVVFGIPSILSVYITRRFLVPSIPQHIASLGNFELTKPVMLMLLFSVLMVFASYSMIKGNGKEEKTFSDQHFNYPVIIAEGLVVGVLTGLVGAGGGFLIIPALVLLSKLDMKRAIGTSLLIIAAKSLIGFLGDLSHLQINWVLLLKVTALAVVGILLGSHWSKKIDARILKKSFGWFVLIVGIYIIIKELFLK